MRITVLGTGYLGAVHAASMASLGHEVLGIDTDAAKVRALSAGGPPFFEPGLREIMTPAVAAGRLRFSTSYAQAGAFGEVHFVCVGTPQLPGSDAADVSAVESAVDSLLPHIGRDCLIVGKSTVPVGTADWLGTRVAELAPPGHRAEVAWNPEFLREGTAVADTLRPERLVAGVASEHADEVLRALYAPLIEAGVPYLSTDLATAELVKTSANAFLATKISFINAIADMCEAAGADVVALTEALGYDSRIGGQAMSAGLGFGGGCLGKDIRALAARAEDLGTAEPVALLRMVDSINTGRRRRVVDAARVLAGGSLTGRRVGVLGVAFKPQTDDVRDSPALAVATALGRQGAQVLVHDPQAEENARAVAPDLHYQPGELEACDGADLVLHLTSWPQYQRIDPVKLRLVVRHARVLDGRNALPLDRWRGAGWITCAFGRPGGSARSAPAAQAAESAQEEAPAGLAVAMPRPADDRHDQDLAAARLTPRGRGIREHRCGGS